MNKYQRILNHYGKTIQLEKAIEELGELKTELQHYCDIPEYDNRKAILKEYGDVMNIMEYLKIIFDFTDEEIFATMHEKLDRQLKRMEG